jgi:lipoprotein NlpD
MTNKSPVRQVTPARHPDYYQVRRGDTLYSIAWQYGLSYQHLASINAIRPPFTIYAGQRLRIRTTAPRPRVSAAPSPPPLATPTQVPAPSPVAPPAPAAPVRPRQSASAAAPAPEFDGNWQWPARGALLRGFNPNAPGKKGIDIAGNPGQPVKAAANGRVVYTGSGLVGYGRLIIVKHDDSLLSAYGHNSKLLVAEGDHVTMGQVIAKMGRSGTHRTELYFEVRKDGKPVDPLRYLPAI